MPGIEGKQNMARMLDRLRKTPPATIGAETVTERLDLWDESGWLGEFKGETDRQSRNFLIYRFGDQASVALRPSGTEPKANATSGVFAAEAGRDVDVDWQARDHRAVDVGAEGDRGS